MSGLSELKDVEVYFYGYNDEFRPEEKFVKDKFLKYNNCFSYHFFVEGGKNDFIKHLAAFNQMLVVF
jgi:hypothetical protein